MARRLTPLEAPITIEVDGRQLPAREGEPLAAAMLAAGEDVFARSAKYHRPRGPYCMSGGCSQCLMRVDGVPNVPTCRTPARPGMRVEHQNAFPDAQVDLLRATDFVFPKWFDHHEFLAGLPLADKVITQVALKLAGLGTLPDEAALAREPAVLEELPLALVGAGAAGLAAAKQLEAAKVPYVLFEKESLAGGRLIAGAETNVTVWAPPAERLRLGATVLGLFADEGEPTLAVVQRGRLHLVRARRMLLAPGGQPLLVPFENNDLPGVFAARAVSTLIRRYGVLPGERLAVVGDAQEARDLAALITSVGGEPVAIGAAPVKAHGKKRVSAVTVREGAQERRVSCDAIAVCGPLSPAFELAQAGGARVAWDPRCRLFVVEADGTGRTANPALWVAGEVRGAMSAAAAAEQGRLAGDELARGAR